MAIKNFLPTDEDDIPLLIFEKFIKLKYKYTAQLL